jgi:hypothetical protein
LVDSYSFRSHSRSRSRSHCVTYALSSFSKRPLTRSEVTDSHLIVWYFEDALKLRFAEFVKILEVCKQISRPLFLTFIAASLHSPSLCVIQLNSLRCNLTFVFYFLLEVGSHDTILNFRQKMVKFAFELLCEKPEQEQQLLALIINKLV